MGEVTNTLKQKDKNLHEIISSYKHIEASMKKNIEILQKTSHSFHTFSTDSQYVQKQQTEDYFNRLKDFETQFEKNSFSFEKINETLVKNHYLLTNLQQDVK